MGVVHLKGAVKSGTLNQTIFTLPLEYRPSQNKNFIISAYTTAFTFGTIIVGSDGTVKIFISGTPTEINLSSISFRVEE